MVMSPVGQSTPTSQVTPTVAVSNAPTGTWHHPRLDEINRRLQASSFSERNIRTILWNLLALAFLIFAPKLTQALPKLQPSIARLVDYYAFYGLNFCRAIPIFNIITAMYPLLGPKDDLSDIPLTPSQRALFGLDPDSQSSTPGSQCITPPRYSRSPTPRSDSRSNSRSYSNKDAPPGVRGDSPSASPLFQKTVSKDVTRRLSYGTSSPLSVTQNMDEASSSLTAYSPSPIPGKGQSVGLNSRWLYERERSPSAMKSVYTYS